MREIGQMLKQAREEKGLLLERLASETMIAKKYLQALEEGNFNVFPGEVYFKGALRRYAGELGLDAGELLVLYTGNQPQKKEETAKNIPVKSEKIHPVASKPVRKGSRHYRINTGRLAMMILIVVVLVGGSFSFSALLKRNGSNQTDPPPIGDENGPESSLPVLTPEPEPEPEPLRVERDASQDRVRFNVFHAETVEVQLVFDARCWIRAEADGVKVINGNFSNGQTQLVTANREVKVRLGYPPGVKLVINGQSVDLPDTRDPYDLYIHLE